MTMSPSAITAHLFDAAKELELLGSTEIATDIYRIAEQIQSPAVTPKAGEAPSASSDEPVVFHNPWRAPLENCINGSNYLRAQEYRDLIDELDSWYADAAATPQQAAQPVQALREALKTAEAALADIGDADRELGDNMAWCERRARKALPEVRAALATPASEQAAQTHVGNYVLRNGKVVEYEILNAADERPDGTYPLYSPSEQAAQTSGALTDAQITELWCWSGTSEAESTSAPTQQHAFARAILAATQAPATPDKS